MVQLENAAPVIYAKKSRTRSDEQEADEAAEDLIDEREIFDLLRDINDPEHPLTLEQLNVVQEELIAVHHDQRQTFVDVLVSITPGSHNTEEAINRQLHDKERVAAAMENPNLLYAVNKCLTPLD